ncbi:hypothetical protein [Streptacidiphilus cavernicola]|uniref:NB-ARC domain-containing protein n=1 Tax=Streptacidiphilus cavernicola TaxID=3342716 RepID=A0ABV6VNB6_9ACTN
MDAEFLSAVVAFLTALNQGVASEAAKAVTDGTAQLLRRCAGRPVALPSGEAQAWESARMALAASEQRPELRSTLEALMRVPLGAAGDGRVPMLLPPTFSQFFYDRREAIKALDREHGRAFAGRARLVNLCGPAGIGLTSAVAYWTAENLSAFTTGGVVYLRLRGGRDATAATQPVTILQQVLKELGVPVGQLRADRKTLAERYRREVVGRRLLVILDGVHDRAQVSDFVVAAEGLFTVMLSREPLLGLARPVPVGPLPTGDARRLLRSLTPPGAAKVARAAERRQLALCQGSPWALTAMGPVLRERPHLATARGRTADLHTDVLDALHGALSDPSARAYRLLGQHPWPLLTTALAGRILGVSDAEVVLKELTDRQLLATVDGPVPGYAMPEHVQRHAAQLSERTDRLPVRTAALRRAVGYLLTRASVAGHAAFPDRWLLGDHHVGSRQHTETYPSKDAALQALGDMADSVIEGVRAAEQLDDAESAAYLCQALWPVQLNAGLVAEAAVALAVAVRLVDQHLAGTALAARIHVQYALALDKLGQPEGAERHLRTALDYDRRCGHFRGQATALESLGLVRLADPLTRAEALAFFEQAEQAAAHIAEGTDGFEDLPRILALLTRHRGRALCDDPEAARSVLGEALVKFAGLRKPDRYNQGKTHIDIAATHMSEDRLDLAAAALDSAIELLTDQAAAEHLKLARNLRASCLNQTV